MRSSKRIQNDIQNSFNKSSYSYSGYKYHLIPSLPNFKNNRKYIKLGLLSFALDDSMFYKKKGDDKKFYWYFKCNKIGKSYCDFFLKCTMEIFSKYKVDIASYNEYSFPSFLHQRGRNNKYNHNRICEELQNISNANNGIIFPGTLNVCDEESKDDYGYAQGYLFQPNVNNIKVRKNTKAESIYNTLNPPENFKRDTNFTLNIFRTYLGNFSIAICADFIDKDHNRFFNEDYVSLDFQHNSQNNDDYKELSLLIAPARDKSGTVRNRAFELSQKTGAYIAYVDSLEHYTDKNDERNSSNVFYEGKYIDSTDIPIKNENGIKAYLKIYDIDFSAPQKKRFMERKINPKTPGEIRRLYKL